MTKVTSTRRKNRLPGSLYGNCDLGDQDKLMITYNRDQTHDYTMNNACSVIYQGNMHFFGGGFMYFRGEDLYTFDRQHFIIETNRSGKMVKITKMKDLDQSSVDTNRIFVCELRTCRAIFILIVSIKFIRLSAEL